MSNEKEERKKDGGEDYLKSRTTPGARSYQKKRYRVKFNGSQTDKPSNQRRGVRQGHDGSDQSTFYIAQLCESAPATAASVRRI